MSAYNELIKNFESIRAYMMEFYIYGFKRRTEYDGKSPRSYDDAKRRLESWLGGYMNYVRMPEGKNVFISIDSRTSPRNPLYKAWKAKSFTDGDITLHFILLDILHGPETSLTLPEIMDEMNDEYLCRFDEPMMFDESTVRKKLKEYVAEGIFEREKAGRSVRYRRARSADLSGCGDMLQFFSEAAPCGVIGSFMLDRLGGSGGNFFFKHHYITGAMDSDVVAELFDAMGDGREVSASRLGTRGGGAMRLVPLRILISAQNGRSHLLAYLPESDRIRSYRVDYLSNIRAGAEYPAFDALRKRLDRMRRHMWGVVCEDGEKEMEHVEFCIAVSEDEAHIARRLEREKRIGTVEKIDAAHYRFSADVYDTFELIPWIRTFICRITSLEFSNKKAADTFKKDLEDMYGLYGIGGGAGDDI